MIERRFRHDPDDMAWIAGAACIGEDPELFFPVGSAPPAAAQVARAKAVCAGCPVRTQCLEWSLVTCQDAGVWGGLDEEQRRDIRRARRRASANGAPGGAGSPTRRDDRQLTPVG